MSEAFPKVAIVEELPTQRECIVEIAGVRCRAVTTITGSSSATPRLSLTVNPLDAAESSSPLLQVEAPLTDQPTWNLCSWQDFLTQTIGVHPPVAPSVTAAPAEVQHDLMRTLQQVIDQRGPEAAQQALDDVLKVPAAAGESDGQQQGEPGGERSF